MNIIFIILVFGIIIIIHELGHFSLAKKNGITVSEFSIGMGPRLASFVRKGTRYSLKLFPFGGSCIMLGEDEAVDDEGAFSKKSVWARISVIIAGPIFNFIFAFLLALIVISSIGIDKPYIDSIEEGGPAYEAGLRKGDTITKIDGDSIKLGRDLDYHFIFNPLTDKPVKVTYKSKNGKTKTVTVTPVMKERYMLGFNYDKGLKIDGVIKDYPLEQAGVKAGDVIVGINGIEVKDGTEFADYIKEHPLGNTPITISYKSGDSGTNTITVTPKLLSEYNLGFGYNIYREKISPVEVITYSFSEVRFNIESTIKSLGFLIRGKVGLNDIAGPVGIVDMMNDVVQESKPYGLGMILLSVANFCILISANLGVMNLLPIPALDGGRLVFHLVEVVRGKPVAKEKEAMVHMIGMAALMLLMVVILFNDIRRLFG